MKKFLKFLLVLIIVLVVGLLIAGLVMPKDITVSRSTLIKAPKEAVFAQIVLFKNWPNWSPFYRMDTAMKITYTGKDGTAGSTYSWESKSSDVGAGTMTNKNVAGTKMDYHLDFLKPFKNQADGYMQASDTAGITKVTWSFSMHCGFPFNALQLFPFMNMDKMVGGSFESGLATMKRYVEIHPSMPSDVEITEVDYPAHVFEGIRKVVGRNDMSKFFMDSYETLGQGMGDKISGSPVGLYYTWDTVNKNADMAAAFPVSDTSKAVDGATFIHIDQSKALMTVQKGGYSSAPKYHGALMKEVAARGKIQTVTIEEYLVGPGKEPDSTKWITNIYYLIK
jgi:effector-binding domain-containing protein